MKKFKVISDLLVMYAMCCIPMLMQTPVLKEGELYD